MIDCLIVGIGGFLGSVCRYLIGLLPMKAGHGFPVKTLLINVAGAFVIGLIAALGAKGKAMDPRFVLMLKVGVCGGFTTFSTFAYESAELLQSGRIGMAAAYAALSVILGVLAIFAAQILVR